MLKHDRRSFCFWIVKIHTCIVNTSSDSRETDRWCNWNRENGGEYERKIQNGMWYRCEPICYSYCTRHAQHRECGIWYDMLETYIWYCLHNTTTTIVHIIYTYLTSMACFIHLLNMHFKSSTRFISNCCTVHNRHTHSKKQSSNITIITAHASDL